MRALRVLTVALCVVSLVAVSCDRDDERETDRDGSAIKVWTVNLEHLLPEHNWQVLVERMSEHDRAPDIVFLQELDAAEADTVVAALEGAFGDGYELRHAPIGDNVVAWNRDRLSIVNEITSTRPDDNELLWEPWGLPGCRNPSEKDPSQVVAVRLWDRTERKTVVAAAVHWGRTFATACMAKNLEGLDALLEERWSVRELTVIGGDFNAHPDKQPHPSDPHRENLDSGRQTDPECWYRSFSAIHPNRLDAPRTGDPRVDCTENPSYRASADTYYDAVFLAAGGAGDALCDQWTSLHGAPAVDGSACTDENGDGLRDRGRIDYLWVRWETGDGVPLLPGEAVAATLIEDASADLVCISDLCADTRYSDHRAVSATVSFPRN
jgi:hypothetical protein